jgi:hypothetical protein
MHYFTQSILKSNTAFNPFSEAYLYPIRSGIGIDAKCDLTGSDLPDTIWSDSAAGISTLAECGACQIA